MHSSCRLFSPTWVKVGLTRYYVLTSGGCLADMETGSACAIAS